MRLIIKSIIGSNWMKWVIYNLLAVFLGLWLVNILLSISDIWLAQSQYIQGCILFVCVLRPLVLATAYGAVIASIQWLILRPILKGYNQWILLAISGLVAGNLVFLFHTWFFNNMWGDIRILLAAGIILGSIARGALYGWFQSRAFNNEIMGAKNWIKANASASFLGLSFAFELTLSHPTFTPMIANIFPGVPRMLIAFAISSGLEAFITGLLIRWILLQPSADSI